MRKILLVSSALLLVVSCHTEAPSAAAPPSPPAPAAPAPAAAGTVAVAGIHFTPPAGWVAEGPHPMRVATYQVPRAPGDSEDSECAVYYFGRGQGGEVQANLSRWLGQFQGPPAKWDRQETMTVSGVPVTEVEQAGTFLWSASPMSPEKTPKPSWRLLGAIVQAPEGLVFLKLTGPAATVSAARPAFDGLLKSIAR